MKDCPAPTFRCDNCGSGEWCLDCARDVHRYDPLHNIEVRAERIAVRLHEADGKITALSRWNVEPVAAQGRHRYRDTTHACRGRYLQDVRVQGHREFPHHPPQRRPHNAGATVCMQTVGRCRHIRTADAGQTVAGDKREPADGNDPSVSRPVFAVVVAGTFERVRLLSSSTCGDRRCIHIGHTGESIHWCGQESLLIWPVRRVCASRSCAAFGSFGTYSSSSAGRAHEDGGIEGTPEGALAIPCPACPRDGDNIPKDWRTHRFP